MTIDISRVKIERHRASVTQGEVSVYLDGKLINRYGDKVELCTAGHGSTPHTHNDGAVCFGGFHGLPDAHWHEVAAQRAGEVLERRWKLPASKAELARERVGNVNRKIVRAGLAPYALSIEAAEPAPVFDDHHANGTVTVNDFPRPGMAYEWPTRDGQQCQLLGWTDEIIVTVTGNVPCYAGWEFVAALENDPHAGVLTRVVPGLEINLDTLRARDASECDHCQTVRDRRKVYAVRHRQTGELRQIGSSCLPAFLGIDFSISDLAFTNTLDEDLDGLCGSDSLQDRSFNPLDVLAITVFMIARAGWVSRSAAGQFGGTPTSTHVMDVLCPPNSFAAREHARDVWASLSDADRETAARVLDYARTLTGDSEYTKNLAQVAAGERVGFRNVGLLASAVAGYNRHIERIIMEQTRQASTHQGVVGARWLFQHLTVTRADAQESQWGLSYLVKLADRDGNVFTWFASRFSFHVGDVVDVLATVKEHTTWQENQETQITRATVTAADPGPVMPHRARTKPAAKRTRTRKATAPAAAAPAPAPVSAPFVSAWGELD